MRKKRSSTPRGKLTVRRWARLVWAAVGYLGLGLTGGRFLIGSLAIAEGEDVVRTPSAGSGSPSPSIRDSRWPLLLVDTTQVAVNEGVSLTVCEAVKHPDNPVLRFGPPGAPDAENVQLGGVHFIDGRFRMWYWTLPAGQIAYAESDDGVHWVRPHLGLATYRGSKKNNLVPGLVTGIVYYDRSDPDRPFKAPVPKGNPRAGYRHSLWTWAWSSDGLRWHVVDRPLPTRWVDAEGQILTRVGDRWVIYAQGLTPAGGRVVRAFHSPRLDRPFWEWDGFTIWTYHDKYRYYQTHGAVSPWPRPGLTLGLCGQFLDRHELEDTRVDLGLLLSHDGLSWWEPWPLATILRRGNAGEWDSTFLLQGYPPFVNVGDKTFLYYSGSPRGNETGGMQIGLATLRRDGFGYLAIDIGWTYTRPGPRTGAFVTVPIRLHDKRTERVLLNLDNVHARLDRWVKVELLDRQGRPIPGYTLADADPITTEGIAVPATWHGRASLEHVPADIVRLRVQLHGGRYRAESPRVYAIYFTPPAD